MHKLYKALGLFLIAAALLCGSAFSHSAQAADSSTGDSGTVAQPGGGSDPSTAVAIPKFLDYMKKGKRSEDLDSLAAKLGQLDGMLNGLQDKLGEIDALKSEIVVMGGDLVLSDSAMLQQAGEGQQQVETAAQYFSQNIAVLLDPALAEQVSSSLSSLQQQLDATAGGGAQGDDFEARLSALDERVSALLTALSEASQASGDTSTEAAKRWPAGHFMRDMELTASQSSQSL